MRVADKPQPVVLLSVAPLDSEQISWPQRVEEPVDFGSKHIAKKQSVKNFLKRKVVSAIFNLKYREKTEVSSAALLTASEQKTQECLHLKQDLSAHSLQDLEKLRDDIILASLPYSSYWFATTSHPHWDVALSAQLTQQLKERFQGDLSVQLGAYPYELIDKSNGLVAEVIVNTRDKTVSLIFGGTTSGGLKSRNLFKRIMGNGRMTLLQWRANLQTALSGHKAASMEKACLMTELLVATVESDVRFEGYRVELKGHSKGVAEAVCASLTQKEPLAVVGFCAADLNRTLVDNLPPENRKKALDRVALYYVQYDPVRNLRSMGLPVQPLGMETKVPKLDASGAPVTGLRARLNLSDRVSRHGHFVPIMLAQVNERIRELKA